MNQIALFLVTKRFSIADEKLKVARVRLVDVRIVNLVDDAVTQREPNAATGMIGRPHAFFRARSPAWLDPRRLRGPARLVLAIPWLVTLPWFRVILPVACHFLDRLDVQKGFTVGYHVTAVATGASRKETLPLAVGATTHRTD